MINNDEAKALIDKFNEGKATEEEKALLDTWYLQYTHADAPRLSEENYIQAESTIWDNLQQQNKAADHQPQLWRRLAVAASVLLCLSIGGYYLLKKPAAPQQFANVVTDIHPGGNKAILTLSSGRQIDLTNAKSGSIATEDQTTIRKAKDGTIIYDGKGKSSSIVYNTITTPKGGQWPLVLPDGSKVLLDAASSITYPVAFTGERKVEITGQVYFEVVHNSAKPFRVSASGQTVEDLGTEFNINAYQDETVIRTTLAKGKISIEKGGKKAFLKPGQQGSVKPDGNTIAIADADMDETLAWKNGYFNFNDEKIENVMRQIARWYNVDVVFNGKITKEGFNGGISRNKNISQVLKLLQKTNAVHFKIEGRRVIVME
jgi:transmembrane sensor